MNASDIRVGLIGPLPPPSGGMANQTRQLAELLGEEGASIDLVPINRPYHPTWIAKVKGVRALFRLIPYLCALWKSADQVRVFHVMANSGWSWHLFVAPAVWIARLRRVPVIINYRGGNASAFFDRSYFWVRPTLRQAKEVVVPSGFLLDVFNNRNVRAKVIPNVVNLSQFSPSSKKRTGPPHIVITRNLEPIYDISTALTAFARLRTHFQDARLTVAGSGPEREALEAQALALDISEFVHFTGRLERGDVAQLYKNADLLLNPSQVDNMPNSILEALASGVPVVSTNVGGVPYMVEHGRTALLVPPRDPTAMCDAAIRVLTDAALRDHLVAAGLQLVRRFEWKAVRAAWLTTYRQAGQSADSSCARKSG